MMQRTLTALEFNTLKKLIGNKNIITNIYRREAYNFIMCQYLLILC